MIKVESQVTPIFGSQTQAQVAPKFQLPLGSISKESAYQIVHDEAMLDGNSRLNMATFVATWMDPMARKIMTENMDKNMIDKTEYPQTAEIERRCVNIIADLWHSPEADGRNYCMGTSTVGSSEACMLGGIAALKRWQQHRREQGKDTQHPNMVISTAFQVVWEKFSVYWDVEMRFVPITQENITLNAQDAIERCDEHTIMVVAIQGVTQTGLNDDVKAINDALEIFNKQNELEIPIHVDAATGGFILPFTQPELEWDFRLKWVYSISVSGHKFGLVYPGVGWVVWRGAKYLPEQMNFSVNYLGSEIPSISINFSRPGNQVLAQYYQFLRLGRSGYEKVQENSINVCHYLRERLEQMEIFEFISMANPNPLFIWKLKADHKRKWTLYDLSDRLREGGWQVPSYTLPESLEDIVVMRIVARQGMGVDLADLLLDAIRVNVKELEELEYPTQSKIAWDRGHKRQRGFNHSR
ncbi:MAG: glutamate decarboxylase [Rikenellaceae bacterium]